MWLNKLNNKKGTRFEQVHLLQKELLMYLSQTASVESNSQHKQFTSRKK